MAKRAHAYPQVEPAAAGLVSLGVAAAPAGVTVDAALALVRRRDAAAVDVGRGRWVLRDDLARAAALGLGELGAARLARVVPAVGADESEVAVRRRLATGARLAIVHRDGRALGAVAPLAPATPGMALAGRVARTLPPELLAFLGLVGRLARAQGGAAYAVGGLVRDVLLGRAVDRRDVDIVVEGDGLALARALAERAGGTVLEHARFLTASVETAATGRIDVATARTERYDVPGALPRVLPAAVADDLGRRDFTINAMAIELASGAFGLLDPFGGRGDLARRRLAVLHPLSFVEDPTRIFRGARYAARFGFALDAATTRAQALALARVPYPALSGTRITTEIARILADERPAAALRRLGLAGAFRLLDPGYRFTAATAARVSRLPAARAWAAAHGLAVDGVELAVVALLAGQRPDVADRALTRLGLTGEPRVRVERALASGGGGGRRARSGARGRPSARAEALRSGGDLALAGRSLAGGPTARAAEWFVREARRRSPVLRGDDVIALGVPRGPQVATVLAALRDAQLDGVVRTRGDEVDYVRHWLTAGKEG